MSKKPVENSSKKNNASTAELKNGKNENRSAGNEAGNAQPAQTKQGHDREQNKKSHENKHK
ncbi:hypothetical protein [Sodalis sp. C49]|uniref:hypothetical protein n=1 Tax=unclassified Sodalis (in: enterobacteria) TaxID=2636512 RepID=UPI003965B820